MLDPERGHLGNYDPISNIQFGTVVLFHQGVDFGFTNDDVTGLAFTMPATFWPPLIGKRVLTLILPAAPSAIQVGNSMAVAIDGVPADATKPSANARQRIGIIGGGYNRFTEIEFPRVASDGQVGFVRVSADAVSADGTILEVVVPDEAVTGKVRIAGAPGDGIFLQVTPTIRSVLPADANFNFDAPLTGIRWGLLGSGLVKRARSSPLAGPSSTITPRGAMSISRATTSAPTDAWI